MNQIKGLRPTSTKLAFAQPCVNLAERCAQQGDLPGTKAALKQIESVGRFHERTLISLAPLLGKSFPNEIREIANTLSYVREEFITAAALGVAETDLEKAMKLLADESLHQSQLTDFAVTLSKKDLLLGFRAAKYIEDDVYYAIAIAAIGAACKFVPRPPSDQVAVGYADLVKPLPKS